MRQKEKVTLLQRNKLQLLTVFFFNLYKKNSALHNYVNSASTAMPNPHHSQQNGDNNKRDNGLGRLTVMEQSGQTDAQRRELRQSLRTLHNKMQDMAEELEDVSSSSFATLRQDNNQLWNQVRYTREAVLDGDNLDVLANRAARQVDKLIEVSFALDGNQCLFRCHQSGQVVGNCCTEIYITVPFASFR
jgi:hypothetical protein